MSGSVAPEPDLGKPVEPVAPADPVASTDPDEGVRRGPLSSGKFTIMQLLGLMTLVSVGSVLCATIGSVALPATIALSLITLNYFGLFRFAQTRRGRLVFRWPVWLLFLSSLAMPAMEGCNQKPVYGWELAAATFVEPISMAYRLLTSEERPNGPEVMRHCLVATWISLIAMTNLLVVCLPLTLIRNQTTANRPRYALLLALSVPMTWFIGEPKEYLIGGHCWLLTTLLALLAFPCPRRQLAAVYAATLAHVAIRLLVAAFD